MCSEQVRILLLGPMPPPLGGTTVLFRQLVDDLEARDDVHVILVNTTGPQHFLGKTRTWVRVLWTVFRNLAKVDVVTLHATARAVILLAPVVHVVCRCFGKPWVLRKFAGSFDLTYQQLPWPARALVRRTSLSADLCLFETHHLVSFFERHSVHQVAWYPNNRPTESDQLSGGQRARCQRFVFVGHVKPSKGIREIISAAEQLGSEVTVDIYGPVSGGVRQDELTRLENVAYRGVLMPSEVIPTLRQYDALLLPTYHDGEGYPGVILEAYVAGLPVIATEWRAIPEIVDKTSGILVSPHNAAELADAMKRMTDDPALFEALRAGTKQKRQDFSSSKWTCAFAQLCRDLVELGSSRVLEGSGTQQCD